MSDLSDFNDLAREGGNGAVATSIKLAITKHQAANENHVQGQPVSVEDFLTLAPPRMAEEGIVPLLREIVDAACASSEAHPVAVAANAIAFFCATVGRANFQRIGDAAIHCRPFFLVVGKSGKARKGTAEHTVREVFKRADAILRVWAPDTDRLRIHAGGLSTGEGVAYAIRDPVEADDKGKGGDLGVTDKRLLVIESEFGNVLAQVQRDNNTLSATTRNLFDGRDISPLTKTSRTTATNPHVVIIGHITGHELKEKSTENDAANGMLNRFMTLHVARPKLVALPEPTDEAKLDALARRVAEAVVAATAKNLHGNNAIETTFSDAAKRLWVERYPQLTRDRDGKGGSLLARSEVYARMLAMIFAAMDGRHEMRPDDLLAAIAWVEYWNASVTYIFNCPDEEGGLDPFTSEVLKVIHAQPGIKLSELQERWKRKRTREVHKALELLLNLAPPLVEEIQGEPTSGRTAKKYRALEKR
ncbi:hypothetical protein [Propionivibrio sp.]|uniref:hypothetical protein n=1 Tax=Propionivibrio sp. TaxID=2212460 RepID=UPI003BF255F3